LILEADSPAPDFNVDLNDRPAAGQTMPQFHLHVIPRRTGDVADLQGDLRWVITEGAKY
jgi:diadenosine tetraphosphate (Ap4A) HIT family hydrolase